MPDTSPQIPPEQGSSKPCIYCMHCGTGNWTEEYACDRCGERVYVPDPGRPPPLGFTSCLKCASANESHASFCARCGSELDHHTRISPAGAGTLIENGNETGAIDDGLRTRSFGNDSKPRRADRRVDVMLRRSLQQIELHRDRNNSQDDSMRIPPEVRRWNWSAFILGPIWGVYHRIWWSLLGLLPLLPFLGLPIPFRFAVLAIMAIMLGLKGNELAWRSGRWESSEKFLAIQQIWSTISILIALGALLSFIAFLLLQ